MTSKITVGTTWKRSFIEKIIQMNREIGQSNEIIVGEVYGSIPGDLLGSARSKDRLHKCDYGTLGEHVKLCHDGDIEVAYANNALCIGSSNEFPAKVDLYIEHLSRLDKIGVDSVMFSIPLFIELTKKYFPNIKSVVSTIAHVDSVKMASYYKDLGAQTIIIPLDANRNFKLLKSLPGNFPETEFELLMTDACIFECPYRQNHFASQSHDSIEDKEYIFHEDVKNYPFDRCWETLTTNWPSEFLKSRWIRPEDIEAYESIGYKKFKISGRTMPEELILKSIKGYLSREYYGNFLDILPIIPGDYKKEGMSQFYINNKKLDGFLDYFLNSNVECETDCSTECNYCNIFAENMKNDN